MRPAPLLALALAAGLVSACGSARELQSAASTNACAGCHGFPPQTQLSTGRVHPASTQCHLCHATTVDENGNLATGNAHGNNRVDRSSHALPFVAQHTALALADLAVCTECHGADHEGGESGRSCSSCHATFGFTDWKTNCSFCHGTRTPGWTPADFALAAPPQGARGETLPSERQVGAHAKHVGVDSSLSNGFACGECHAPVSGLAHVDGTAAVAFGAFATPPGLTPTYTAPTCSSTYCHGVTLTGGSSTSPSWTGSAACGSCHGAPPTSGLHRFGPHASQFCSECHADVGAATLPPGIAGNATARGLHVNGAIDVRLGVPGTYGAAGNTCSSVACHPDPRTYGWY